MKPSLEGFGQSFLARARRIDFMLNCEHACSTLQSLAHVCGIQPGHDGRGTTFFLIRFGFIDHQFTAQINWMALRIVISAFLAGDTFGEGM
ncbi:hypothetical protein Enr13x_66350 [Stieleria neptunia]|uniref:Uncharacterized protein n=1 Tax=Stieleria neptunia TaxID=2527979 RepID=A0A518I0X0_9BACT|nr:hypothetical protein Enr13x_66350 [Stieleria neptunia]